jgi:tetratricopeptide (TPR) repeat protein
LRSALAVTPADGDLHFLAGAVLQAQGHPQQALGHYEAALRINPTLHSAHYNTGLVHRAAGDPLRARSAFLSAIALRPTCALTLNNIGLTHYFAGDHATAIQWFDRAVEAAGASATVTLTTASLSQRGDAGGNTTIGSEAAVGLGPAAIESAMMISSAVAAEAHFNRGVCLERQGRALQAEAAYRAAMAAQPSGGDVWGSAAMNLAALCACVRSNSSSNGQTDVCRDVVVA